MIDNSTNYHKLLEIENKKNELKETLDIKTDRYLFLLELKESYEK